VGDPLGAGDRVGLVLTLGRTSVGVGGGAVDGGVDGAVGDGVSPGNSGFLNRYLSGSSFSAAIDLSMNCRQIGPGPLAPYTS
jgi:hypothetical protein